VPRIIVTEGAVRDLERCRHYLRQRSLEAARRAARAIAQRFSQLAIHPALGRPVPDTPELRELIIPFGDAGYVVLYRHEPVDDAVYILAVRHQREAGY
jgi:plasmid stabilization system protein ParE